MQLYAYAYVLYLILARFLVFPVVIAVPDAVSLNWRPYYQPSHGQEVVPKSALVEGAVSWSMQ
jgi:hypothetical protein